MIQTYFALRYLPMLLYRKRRYHRLDEETPEIPYNQYTFIIFHLSGFVFLKVYHYAPKQDRNRSKADCPDPFVASIMLWYAYVMRWK